MGEYVIQIAIANAFLLFPLIIAAAEAVWGPSHNSVALKIFVYIAAFSVIPLVGPVGYWARRVCVSLRRAAGLLDIGLTAPGIVAAVLYLSPDGSFASLSRIEHVAALAGLCSLAGVALAFLMNPMRADQCDRVCRPIVDAVRFIAPLAYLVVLLWGEGGWLINQLEVDRGFQVGLLAGAGCVTAIYGGPRLLRSRSRVVGFVGRLLLAVCGMIAVLVILSIGFHAPYAPPATSCPTIDLPLTYGYWVGTAAQVLDGGVPMVDAHSQYGLLAFLVYALPFEFLLPASYWGAIAVTELLNLVALAIVIAICLKTARNRFLVLIVVVALAPVLPWVWHLDPANSAPRFAPPLLLLLALAWLRPGRTWNLATCAAIVLCSLWSLECLIWTFLGYIAFLVATALEQRDGISAYLRSLIAAAFSIVAAHSVFCMVIYYISGHWPRYDIYLAFFTGAMPLHLWVAPELANPIWVLQFGVCVAALAYGLAVVLWRDQASTMARSVAARLILPGAVITVLELSYWVSRPYHVLLWEQALPSLVAAILTFDELCTRDRFGSMRLGLPRQWAPHITLAASLVVLVGAAGYIVKHYQLLNLHDTMLYYRAVATGKPVESCIGQRAADAVALVEKYNADKRDALFFMPAADDVSVELYSHHRQRLGYSIISFDTLSAPLMREADRRLLTLAKQGDVFVTMAYSLQPKSGFTIDNYVMSERYLSSLASRFQECEIERTPRDVVAVRLVPKDNKSCAGVGKPFVYKLRIVD
ncbi:MAG: hypothetical protein ACHQRJ_02155 [Alphaproteobacteria bacterium]